MKRIEPGPGQESVWDYPRPPRLEPTSHRIRVVFAGRTIAESVSAWRLLETSHPPGYYIPNKDVDAAVLVPSRRQTHCEWKGRADYYSLQWENRASADAAWVYPHPTKLFSSIAGHFAFYPGRVDACYVDDELVRAQAGGFYGGWITNDLVGPFKGEPGTEGW